MLGYTHCITLETWPHYIIKFPYVYNIIGQLRDSFYRYTGCYTSGDKKPLGTTYFYFFRHKILELRIKSHSFKPASC